MEDKNNIIEELKQLNKNVSKIRFWTTLFGCLFVIGTIITVIITIDPNIIKNFINNVK